MHSNPLRRDLSMKIRLLTFAIFFFTGFSNMYAQNLVKDGDHYEFVFISADAGKAHTSADVFATQVGTTLKIEYPSRILNPAVDLAVFIRNNAKIFRFTWSCRIVKTSPENADYYFDRRGTLLFGKTLTEVKRNVEIDVERSGKIWAMRKNFRGAKIPESFIRDSFAGSSLEGYWYVKEFFLVAPK
jgi:hypothetical protein